MHNATVHSAARHAARLLAMAVAHARSTAAIEGVQQSPAAQGHAASARIIATLAGRVFGDLSKVATCDALPPDVQQFLAEHPDPCQANVCGCFDGMCRCQVVDGRTTTGAHCKAQLQDGLTTFGSEEVAR